MFDGESTNHAKPFIMTHPIKRSMYEIGLVISRSIKSRKLKLYRRHHLTVRIIIFRDYLQNVRIFAPEPIFL